MSDDLMCPWCGGKMVCHETKNFDYFMVCVDYPHDHQSPHGSSKGAVIRRVAILSANLELAKATLWWDAASLSEEASGETIQLAEEEMELAIAKVRELEAKDEDEPCPNCGGIKQYLTNYSRSEGPDYVQVTCDCGLCAAIKENRKEAIQAWNDMSRWKGKVKHNAIHDINAFIFEMISESGDCGMFDEEGERWSPPTKDNIWEACDSCYWLRYCLIASTLLPEEVIKERHKIARQHGATTKEVENDRT